MQTRPIAKPIRDTTVEEDKDKYAIILWGISHIAFLAIAALGVAGVISPTAIGASAIGLSVIPNVVLVKLSEDKDLSGVLAITSLFWTVLGSLTIGGAVSSTTLGYLMLFPTAAFGMKKLFIHN